MAKIRRAEALEILQQHKHELAEKYGVTRLGIFGSVARGEDGEKSDIDFLVEMEKGRSLLDRASLLVELEILLGRKVDVATERTLRRPILEHALEDAAPL